MDKNIKGTIMVLVAGITWGISGISGQYLMANGMNINLLSSLRLIVSGLLLTVMAMVYQPQHFSLAIRQKRVLAKIAVFALFGFLMNNNIILMVFNNIKSGTGPFFHT